MSHMSHFIWDNMIALCCKGPDVVYLEVDEDGFLVLFSFPLKHFGTLVIKCMLLVVGNEQNWYHEDTILLYESWYHICCLCRTPQSSETYRLWHKTQNCFRYCLLTTCSDILLRATRCKTPRTNICQDSKHLRSRDMTRKGVLSLSLLCNVKIGHWAGVVQPSGHHLRQC